MVATPLTYLLLKNAHNVTDFQVFDTQAEILGK